MKLEKGQNLALDGDVARCQVVVNWIDVNGDVDVDLSVLLLDKTGRVRGDDDLVFYNQPESVDGSVRYFGTSQTENGSRGEVLVDLEVADADVECIAFAASVDSGTFGELKGLALQVFDPSGGSAYHFDVPAATTETAFHFGEFYRRNGSWKLRAVGQGWDTGLAGLATHFGVEIEEGAADDASSDSEPDASSNDVVTEPSAPQASPADAAAVPPIQTPGTDDGDQVDVVPAAADEASGDQPLADPSAPAKRGVRTRKPRPRPVMPVALTLAGDESWQPSRLFSIVGVGAAEEQERRATSALLSSMLVVKSFARGITARCGAPRGPVETFLEVGFPLGERTVYPDGVIRVARAGRIWTALLETKTGSGQLRRDQVENYLDVARAQGFDAVVTLSNEIASAAGQHPIKVDQRKLKRVSLYHLSWAEVLHEARMALEHRGCETNLHAWILSELIRYMEHPRSGVVGFEDMGAAWVPVREAALAGTLRPSDRKVPQVADAWARLVRHLCLRLTSDLGVEVTQVHPRRLASDPAARTAAIVQKLAADGVLEATIRIPQAAGQVSVVADIRGGQARASFEVPAPKEGTSARRLGWLLRQLKTAPEAMLVEVLFEGRAESTCEQLREARANPSILIPDRDAVVSGFRLSLRSALGTKRSGVRGAFIPSITGVVEDLYGHAVQKVRPWVPAAPRLPEDAVDDELNPGDGVSDVSELEPVETVAERPNLLDG